MISGEVTNTNLIGFSLIRPDSNQRYLAL